VAPSAPRELPRPRSAQPAAPKAPAPPAKPRSEQGQKQKPAIPPRSEQGQKQKPAIPAPEAPAAIPMAKAAEPALSLLPGADGRPLVQRIGTMGIILLAFLAGILAYLFSSLLNLKL
jgi:hypothetical protein